MEEMHQITNSFKKVRLEKKVDDISHYLNVTEFKGYVACDKFQAESHVGLCA